MKVEILVFDVGLICCLHHLLEKLCQLLFRFLVFRKQVYAHYPRIVFFYCVKMCDKGLLGKLLCSLDVKFYINALNTKLLKKHRNTTTNLNIGHNKVSIKHNLLSLSEISDIASIINASGKESCSCFFLRSSGYQQIS